MYLPLHTFNLNILCLDLIPHVEGHALQIPNNAADMGQVFLHFILTSIISHPVTEQNKVCGIVIMICVWPAAQMMTASFTCQSVLKKSKQDNATAASLD